MLSTVKKSNRNRVTITPVVRNSDRFPSPCRIHADIDYSVMVINLSGEYTEEIEPMHICYIIDSQRWWGNCVCDTCLRVSREVCLCSGDCVIEFLAALHSQFEALR